MSEDPPQSKQGPRSPKDGPWCWQSKAAHVLIRDSFDATHNVGSALAVYSALTEIASDAGAPSFTTTHAWISGMSGISVSTVQRHLKEFSALGLLAVSTPKLKAPSAYTLLAIGNGCLSFGNHDRTFGSDDRAFGNESKIGPRPTSEETEKKEEKKQAEKAAPAPASLALATSNNRTADDDRTPTLFPWDSITDLPQQALRFLRYTLQVSDAYLTEAFTAVQGRKLRFRDRFTKRQWQSVLFSELAAYRKGMTTRPGTDDDQGHAYGFYGEGDPHGDLAYLRANGWDVRGHAERLMGKKHAAQFEREALEHSADQLPESPEN